MGQVEPHPAKREPEVSRFARLSRRVLGLVLLAMVLINLANAMGRYLLGVSIPGSDEVLVFSMVWLVFLGVIVVTAAGTHLSFPAIRERIEGGTGGILSGVISISMAVLAAFVAWQSFNALIQLNRVGQTSMAVGLPMTIPHAAVFISFALVAAVALYRGLVKLQTHWRTPGGAA